MNPQALAQEIIDGRRLTRQDDLKAFLTCDLQALCEGADTIRKHFVGERVDLCSIINGRSGRCPENCKFCAQSAHNHTDCEVYSFLPEEDIVKLARLNQEEGVHRFSIVTAGTALTGEAFDKVARTLGLPYPGGPSVANAAKTGNPKAYRLPVPHVDGKYNVSFSGLKTAVLNEVNKAQMKGEEVNVPDLAASFQDRIAGILAEKLLLAAADTGAKQVCLAGGVAANGRLRQLVNDGAQKLGAKVYLPELKFCGDNGAMIAAQGYYQYIAGHTAGLELNGLPTLPIDYE